MKKISKEILQELVMVFTGKSLDILLPPFVFLILNNIFSLSLALIGSLLLSLFFFLKSILEKSNILYAVSGLLGVILAIALVYINNNAANFFLPDIIATSILVFVTLLSIIIRKPLAIWVSHITRGWDLSWFNRKDVKPAYTEVTYFWLLFFILRLSFEIHLYSNNSVDEIALANIFLGYPLLILILTISYIYGISRLKRLKGPGVDEFKDNILPPWRGQRKGF